MKFFYRGSLSEMDTPIRHALLTRASDRATNVSDRTSAIVAAVRQRGDEALREMALKFDGATIAQLEVPREKWTRALDALPAPLKAALMRAATSSPSVIRFCW